MVPFLLRINYRYFHIHGLGIATFRVLKKNNLDIYEIENPLFPIAWCSIPLGSYNSVSHYVIPPIISGNKRDNKATPEIRYILDEVISRGVK